MLLCLSILEPYFGGLVQNPGNASALAKQLPVLREVINLRDKNSALIQYNNCFPIINDKETAAKLMNK